MGLLSYGRHEAEALADLGSDAEEVEGVLAGFPYQADGAASPVGALLGAADLLNEQGREDAKRVRPIIILL